MNKEPDKDQSTEDNKQHHCNQATFFCLGLSFGIALTTLFFALRMP